MTGLASYGWKSLAEHCHHPYVWPSIDRLLPREPRLSILDAGCGNGFIASRLAERGHKVTGIDSSRDGIELATRAYPAIRWRVGSVYDDLRDVMPSGGWDVIVSTEVVEHLYSPQQFLQNMIKHLRVGGVIIITTPYHGYLKNLLISLINGWDRHFTVGKEGGHIKFFSEATLTQMLCEVGFENIHFKNAGRLPLLWKSMVCRGERAE
ncbi:MAG: methyltransferase domain-containing protein [Sulfuricaulis sp.]|uniref:class I SAM-dependent methyltransferase n=1 Tax=Sulfuricaulis sp. TaxID=2003553 RepID=UPI0034A13BC7